MVQLTFCCICFIAYSSIFVGWVFKVLVLSFILISSVSDPLWYRKIISFDSYLYFPRWYGNCSLTTYKQIFLGIRVLGREDILFLKENGCSSLLFTGNNRWRKNGSPDPVSVNPSNNILPCTSFTSLALGGGGQLVFWAASAFSFL